HSRWIATGGAEGERASFAGRKLRGTDFSGCDLRAADFSEANLSDAHFVCAQLTFTNFTRSDLQRVNFDQACCAGTIFSDANLGAATLRHAQLIGAEVTTPDGQPTGRLFHPQMAGANLNGADFRGARVEGVDFSQAQFVETVHLGSASLVDCKGLPPPGPVRHIAKPKGTLFVD
ncbi:MAG: pentapeptide repeat-containing protein, partial [Ferrovibrio sp.]